MIRAPTLTNRFKGHTAVGTVSLNAGKAGIYDLLGSNNAGKTTVIRMLCGIIGGNEGNVQIDNMSVAMAKVKFDYVAQYLRQYEKLSVWENLELYAQLFAGDDSGF